MSFSAERLSHAYITGNTFADTLAMVVVCGAPDGKKPCKSCVHCDKASRRIHPDIIEIDKLDNKQIIGVDQIRELKKDVYIVPNEANKKVYVVRDADSMNSNAQNAFLQILEEPPAHAVFILGTDNPAALLPTVYSRCVDIKSLSSDTPDTDSNENEELKEIVSDFVETLTGNSIKLMEIMFRIDKFDRFAFRSFLDLAHGRIIQELRKSTGDVSFNFSKVLTDTEKVLMKAGEMLDLNVSSGHISGFICASILK